MILVDEITIEEFRGIRKLTLSFKGKNFAVCGPNGTGKSGVVDALEFGLTGNISRLSGGGTGAISLKKHAPHVDSRDYPEKAKVMLTLRIPSLQGQRVTLERNVGDPHAPIVTPNTPEVLEVLKQLENHPEFVLSRRELIAYVLAQPGKRSEEIQALLRLDQIGELRGTLKTLTNSCTKEEAALKKIDTEARDHLARALEISELKTEKLIEAVNKRRTILGLTPIETLEGTASLHDGLKTNAKNSTPAKINKTEATSDLKTTRDSIAALAVAEIVVECTDLHAQITDLSADPAIADSVSKEKFLRTAISLINEAACPVCDTEWDIDVLRSLVETKLKKFELATKTRTVLENRLQPIVDLLSGLHDAIAAIEKHSKIVAADHTVHLASYRANVASKVKALKSFLPLADTLSSLEGLTDVPSVVIDAIAAVELAVAAIPEPSQQEAARDYLILCQDRLETYREAARDAKRAEEHAALALSVHDTYVEESNKVLEGVYKQVEDEFGGFYRGINNDDEGAFSAKLIPSMGKLGFDVEFYGRGHFPPGAYHSEGHQDGMGLCLYLALMQRLQGANFTFAVLDDVLMSVDTGHRREVCALLKKHFPHTQFVLTTHDEVWLKHMESAGLIGATNSVRFSNWTPDHGPTEWSNRDIWTEIDDALKDNDVHTAASILRYYLEHIFKDVCHNLRAPVEFKGDGRYELGDVLPPAVRRFRDLIVEGKKVAESWERKDDVVALTEREKSVAASLRASNAEQWQINPAVHYNEWANLTAADFSPVANAFKELIQKFSCDKPECGSLYYLSFTTPKTADAVRCSCGHTNINLKKR
jgi:hypothetical protein